MEIGGFFPYEPNQESENNYIKRMCPNVTDVRHLMSGRCAIYYCLQDSLLTDKKKVAYLPSYDCETVLSCFTKSEYEIIYYDIDETLTPVFDESLLDKISIILITPYYGYTTYSMDFVRKCREHGVTIIEDTTHSAFSPVGFCKEADYVAVSLRKWMGVISGGLALKCGGKFTLPLLPSDEVHLKIRDNALANRKEYEATGDETLNKTGQDSFWKAEFMLRKIFDMQAGDDVSYETILYYPLDNAIEKRRENFKYLLENLPENPDVKPIFTELPDDVCPMFFPFFVENRDDVMKHLYANAIPPKVYWPVPPMVDVDEFPGSKYIYDHVMSISCDQRFGEEDMKRVVEVFEKLIQ